MSCLRIVDGPFPYEDDRERPHERPDGRAQSTVEALSRVEFANFDLAGQLAYRDHEFARVWLARKQLRVAGRRRDCILVFDAVDEANEPAALGPDQASGILRPVQRYVLTGGLERVVALEKDVIGRITGDDRWGFVLARRDNERPAAVTPPILEQVSTADRDRRCPSGLPEFILCDGTHRVVQIVWRSRRALAAVAVLGEPSEPYYAYPQPACGWRQTAARRLQSPPAPERRYRVRQVDLSTLPADRRALFHGAPSSVHYRRYFRDLAKGFGHLGGQGGRESPPASSDGDS